MIIFARSEICTEEAVNVAGCADAITVCAGEVPGGVAASKLTTKADTNPPTSVIIVFCPSLKEAGVTSAHAQCGQMAS